MYGFILRPDTLPRAYISWIDQAGQFPVTAVAINRDLVREGSFKISEIDQLLSNPVRSPQIIYNYTHLRTHIVIALGTPPEEPNCAVNPPGNGSRISTELR